MSLELNVNLPGQLDVRETFDRVADRYDQHAVLEREIGTRLLDRLVFQRHDPARIIDLGSGTGHCAKALKRQYRKAEIIAIDASTAMCAHTQRHSSLMRPLRAVCADMAALPLADRSADLVFSNLALQWCEDFHSAMAGFRRILRPGGLLLFSSLGPDSMKELKVAMGEAQNSPSIRQFADMHDIGDALVAAGFAEPVMDSEIITTDYPDIDALVADLEATGANTHISDWNRIAGFGGELNEAYQPFVRNERFPVTWEIVYGAAFGPQEGQPVKSSEGDVATFSVDFLRASRKRQ